MSFCKRLREMRMERQMTQQAVADAIGVVLRTSQCYEQGTREPCLKTLVCLADVLNVSADYLLCRDEFCNKKEEL